VARRRAPAPPARRQLTAAALLKLPLARLGPIRSTALARRMPEKTGSCAVVAAARRLMVVALRLAPPEAVRVWLTTGCMVRTHSHRSGHEARDCEQFSGRLGAGPEQKVEDESEGCSG